MRDAKTLKKDFMEDSSYLATAKEALRTPRFGAVSDRAGQTTSACSDACALSDRAVGSQPKSTK